MTCFDVYVSAGEGKPAGRIGNRTTFLIRSRFVRRSSPAIVDAAAAVGLLGAALTTRCSRGGITSPRTMTMAAAAFVALTAWRTPAWAVVIGAGLVGFLAGNAMCRWRAAFRTFHQRRAPRGKTCHGQQYSVPFFHWKKAAFIETAQKSVGLFIVQSGAQIDSITGRWWRRACIECT
jgi:hypothetical protein